MKKRKGSHFARMEKSDRLMRVWYALKKAVRPLSTMDIIRVARVCAVSSCVSELRMNGYDIACKRKDGKAWYRLTSRRIK